MLDIHNRWVSSRFLREINNRNIQLFNHEDQLIGKKFETLVKPKGESEEYVEN